MVSAAAHAFARQGYDQTTMQDLAASMGLATGALYHYFDGKEKLLMAICDDLTGPLLARAREITDQPSGDRLRTLVRVWVAHVVEFSDHMLVFQLERHVIERDSRWRAVRETRKGLRADHPGRSAPGAARPQERTRSADRARSVAGNGQPHRDLVPPRRSALDPGDRRRIP
jgi:AcrR family transcriptional regulator